LSHLSSAETDNRSNEVKTMKRSSLGLSFAFLSVAVFAFSGCNPQVSDNDDVEVEDPTDGTDQDPVNDPNEDPINDPIDVEPCTYPEQYSPNPTGSGQVIPPVSWSVAYHPSGVKGSFSMETFKCDPAYERYTSMVIVQVAEWCPNCPTYVDYMGEVGQALDDLGMLVVFEVLDDDNPNDQILSDSRSADQYITGYIGHGVGMRLGEAQATPIYALGYMSDGIPFGMVVRKRDMKITVNDNDWPILSYLEDIAADPEADWQAGPPSSCGDDQQETFEPNNSLAEAGVVEAGMVIEGGICGLDVDAYQVNVQGDWRVDLEFSQSVGDLDLYQVEMVGGQLQAVQGSESSDDDESLTGNGPATIWIQGYNGATAPYVLRVTAL